LTRPALSSSARRSSAAAHGAALSLEVEDVHLFAEGRGDVERGPAVAEWRHHSVRVGIDLTVVVVAVGVVACIISWTRRLILVVGEQDSRCVDGFVAVVVEVAVAEVLLLLLLLLLLLMQQVRRSLLLLLVCAFDFDAVRSEKIRLFLIVLNCL
jgi:hypothetical protein